MKSSVIAITGNSDTIYEFKKLLGTVSAPVLWIEWDHEYALFPQPFDFSPSVKHAEKLVYVFMEHDSGSSQLWGHLGWLSTHTPENCEQFVIGLPNTDLDVENVFDSSKDAKNISFETLKELLNPAGSKNSDEQSRL